MENLILFILSTSGLTWILVKSKLFKPLREYFTLNYNNQINNIELKGFNSYRGVKLYMSYFLNSIFNCEGCMGFWSGLFSYLIIYGNISIKILPYSFAGSIISLILIGLLLFINRK